jgi:2-dehydropantoate 2-reductase
VIVGIAGGFGASVVEPGRAHHHGLEVVRLGERSGPATPRLERVAETWRLAGFRVETLDDVERLVWEKLICNVAYSGVCTVLDLTIGEVLDNPHARELSAACAQEAWTVARASGIAVEIDDPVAYVRAFGKKIRGARPSMLLDRHAGRRTEIDAINGAIPPRAEAVGLTAPVNAVISALVRALEA